MVRRGYYNKIGEAHISGPNFCLHGGMGDSHKPTLQVRLYRKTYDSLATAAQDTTAKNRSNPKDCEKFIQQYQ